MSYYGKLKWIIIKCSFKQYFIFSCWCNLFKRCCGPKELKPRTINLGKLTPGQFPANAIRNQKYNIITFLPMVLYQQFKFFLNLYFLIMATSQFVPDIRIGYLYTYWGPLVRSIFCPSNYLFVNNSFGLVYLVFCTVYHYMSGSDWRFKTTQTRPGGEQSKV